MDDGERQTSQHSAKNDENVSNMKIIVSRKMFYVFLTKLAVVLIRLSDAEKNCVANIIKETSHDLHINFHVANENSSHENGASSSAFSLSISVRPYFIRIGQRKRKKNEAACNCIVSLTEFHAPSIIHNLTKMINTKCIPFVRLR